MHRTTLKMSLSLVGLLVAGTLSTGAASAAPAAGEDGDCAGMTWPAASTGQAAAAAPVSATALAGGTVIVRVLPTGSPNAVIATSPASSGSTCIDSSGAIEYFADMGAVDRTDSFKYVVYDGASFASSTVTVTVKGIKGVNPTVLKKAKHGKKAKLAFVNNNDYAVLLLAGAPNKRRPDVKRLVAAHTSTLVKSKRPKLAYVVTLIDPNDPNHNEIPVSYGTVITKSGKVKAGNYADQRAKALAKLWR